MALQFQTDLRSSAARLRARWETAPTPARWLIGALLVLFVVGPVTSLVLWMMWRVK